MRVRVITAWVGAAPSTETTGAAAARQRKATREVDESLTTPRAFAREDVVFDFPTCQPHSSLFVVEPLKLLTLLHNALFQPLLEFSCHAVL